MVTDTQNTNLLNQIRFFSLHWFLKKQCTKKSNKKIVPTGTTLDIVTTIKNY